MSSVQYIDGFRAYAEKLAKTYSKEFFATEQYPTRKRVWKLEMAMHKMENELNIKLTEILEQAETAIRDDIDKLELRLEDMMQVAVREWILKNLEIMNNTTDTKKATVLR
jgi:nucleoside-triphosphatase THEP1